ncbi:MAG: glycosyltransferase family 2 protein [Deferribacterales bacterium]
MKYDIDILIPAYKPQFFRQCLESAAAQTEADNIIISDDCPTDEIYDIVKSFSDCRIQYHRNRPGLGLLQNHMKLVTLSHAKWLKFLDDDDYLTENCLQELKACADSSEDTVIAFCDMKNITTDGQIKPSYSNFSNVMTGEEYLFTHYLKAPITVFTKMLIRSDIMLNIITHTDLPVNMISLDELTGLLAIQSGSLTYTDKTCVYHRLNPAGFSKAVDAGLLYDDTSYITIPFMTMADAFPHRKADVESLYQTMLKKNFRGSYIKLLERNGKKDFYEFFKRCRMISPSAAYMALLNSRTVKKLIKNIFR